MLKKITLIIALFAVPTGLVLAQPAPPNIGGGNDISGTYSVTGTNPDGSRYEGTCTISRVSGDTFRFAWSVGNSYTGTGTLRGNSISVDWGADAPAIYEVQSNGVLRGTWANGAGTETLTPR